MKIENLDFWKNKEKNKLTKFFFLGSNKINNVDLLIWGLKIFNQNFCYKYNVNLIN